MTPAEIETAARRLYNSEGDNFFSSSQILGHIYTAQLELIDECDMLIEGVFSTTTVASQQEYDFPENIASIKRVTYDGQKLEKIDFDEDDIYTIFDSDNTDTGTPRYYFVWDRTIYLRPLPDDTLTLKVFGYKTAQAVTSSSTLDVPAKHHYAIIDYVVREMLVKDQNWTGYDRYNTRWLSDVERIRRDIQRRKRKDKFASVKDEEALDRISLGAL